MSDTDAAIEQIAKDIFISDNSNAADPEKEWDNALAADRGYARYIARGLHSLGYTNSIVHQCCVGSEAAKPRTIETVAELDVLPVGSKVVSAGYEWIKNYQTNHTPGYEAEREVWFNVYDDFETSEELSLPATVLHEPAQ